MSLCACDRQYIFFFCSREANIGFFYDYFRIKLSDRGRRTVTLMHDHGFNDEFFYHQVRVVGGVGEPHPLIYWSLGDERGRLGRVREQRNR